MWVPPKVTSKPCTWSKNSKLAHTCVSKLGRKSGGQTCKRCEKCEGCKKCEWSSHMCEHIFRLKRGFSKVIKVMKWV